MIYPKQLLFSAIVLFLIATNVNAQTFINTYGGDGNDNGTGICVTPNNGIYIVGSTTSFDAENRDIYILRLDYTGDTVWTTYAGIDSTDFDFLNAESGRDIILNSEGNIVAVADLVVAGGADSHPTVLLELNKETGDLIRTRLYQGIAAEAIIETDNGDYLLSGTGLAPFAWPQAVVARLDSDFNMVNSTMYNGSEDESYAHLNTICRFGPNDYLVAGNSSYYAGLQCLVSCVDSTGNLKWSREFSTGIDDNKYIKAMEKYNDTAVVCVGRSELGMSNGASVWFVNSDWEDIWGYRAVGGTSWGRSEFRDVLITPDGNIAACGIFDSTSTWSDPKGLFMLFDKEGNVLKQKILEDTSGIQFNAFAQKDGSYYLTGQIGNYEISDLLFMKTNFFVDDTLCSIKNFEQGYFDPPWATYGVYSVIPSPGAATFDYPMQTHSGTNITEICSHDEVFDAGIDTDLHANLSIYPNPFVNQLHIQSGMSVESVKIIAMNGAVVPTRFSNSIIEFDTELAPGIYILEVKLTNKDVIRKKIIRG